MLRIKTLKKDARKNIKKNYFTIIFVCLIMSIIVGNYDFTFRDNNSLLSTNQNNLSIIVDYLTHPNSESLKEYYNKKTVSENINNELNLSKGVFNFIFGAVNKTENNITIALISCIDLIINNFSKLFMFILIGIFIIFFQLFIKYPLTIGENRFFLENKNYSHTNVKRLLFLFKNKNYLNCVKVLLIKDIFYFLWCLTIIGGFIKYYSYRLVPYILAENPSIKSKDAINLSRELMNHNKWKTFCLDLSFIGWRFLDIITMNLVGIFYSNPYFKSTNTELYYKLKQFGKQNNIEKLYLLNDETLTNKQDLKEYSQREQKIKEFFSSFDHNYTITSLILLFFCFAIVGWLWEVSIHLVLDGRFVNRGVYAGPWIPIYGFGCLFAILMFIPKKTRKILNNPLLTFVIVMVICAVLEYSTSCYLEIMNGEKWWDYSGYFLNLNGRICLEGILFFGVGGCFCIYVIAPFLDSCFNKVPKKIQIICCIILVVLFLIDLVYSTYHPNMGAGITTYYIFPK